MIDRSLHTGLAHWAWTMLAALLTTFAAPAHGLVQADAAETIKTIRAAVPSADLIVVLDDGVGQRQSAPGRAFTAILSDFGIGKNEGEFTRAWSQLARMFGVDNARAFDELFGRRMILVSQDTTITGFGSWAIATVVPEDLGITVIKKLGAKGRETVVGQTVYAIEGGAYRVSLLKPRSSKQSDDNRLLVFSPKDSSELLSRLVRGLVTPRGWKNAIGAGRAFPASVTAVLLEAQTEVARIESTLGNAGWDGLAVFEMPEFEMRSAGWAGDEFGKLSKGAWLSVADEMDLATIADTPIAAILPIDPERLRRLSDHCTGRIYLRVLPELDNEVSLAVCLEMDGSDEGNALADRAVRDIAGLLTANPDAVPDYRGFMPEAVRTAPVRGDFAHDVLRPVIGATPAIAWRTSGKGKTAWWTTLIAPVHSDHTAALDELIALLPAGEAGGALVSAGTVSPGPIVGLIERGLGNPNSVRGTFERIEDARWSTRQNGSRLEIGFEIRMSSDR